MNGGVISLLLLVAVFASTAFAQNQYKGDALNRAKNFMSGNLVRTVFYNYGLVGNVGEISGEWPIGTGDEYVGDVSPLVGVQFVHPNGDTLQSVTTSDGPRQNSDGPPGGGTFWGFEALPGFNAAPLTGKDPLVAVSTDTSTWPEFWPDKMYDDVRDIHWRRDAFDPGWAPREQVNGVWIKKWNGYFGKNVFNADQECYFQMDDQADEEWFLREDSAGNDYRYYPSAEDSARRGLGLRVAVRGLQWAHFLAQDCIFWLYDITNVSSYTYDKVTFGMVVGTLSGGRGDSQDDLARFILASGITYSYDYDDNGNATWQPVRPGEINVGVVGYAFLESPGNPYDGIDNDGDDTTGSAPVFDRATLFAMTEPKLLAPRERLVLIDYDTYERTVVQFPDSGALEWNFRGEIKFVQPTDTLREDGTNGIDDNFNGLIDERNDTTMVGLRYVDYLSGQGRDDAMLDEARDNGIDDDRDWNPRKDDVGGDGVAGTGDFGENDGMPTDGEPNFDKTDVDESDQIGLTAFEYFSPPGAVRMRDDIALWTRMEPGRVDTVNPNAEDGDFIYGSGYFPLKPGQTERFSMAMLYGEDLPDAEDNEATVQQIYNENYNFAKPPAKPTVYAVPGDGQVTLYWDGRASESSFEPICDCYDFEGYKIYRSTDPSFNEVFTVTDGLGRKTFHHPLAQFDYKDNFAYIDSNYFRHIDSLICDSIPPVAPDTVWTYLWCYRDTLVHDSAAVGVHGFFPIVRNSVIYYLGDNTGLRHSYVDNTVENGQTYYYAVCAYDRGDLAREILPSEDTKTISVDESGNVKLDVNCARVTPHAPAAGYVGAQLSPIEHTSGRATGALAVDILDPLMIPDQAEYRFNFRYYPDTTVTDTMPSDSIPGDSLFRELFGYAISREAAGRIDTLIPFAELITDPARIGQAIRFGAYYDSLFNLRDGTYEPAKYFDVAATRIYDGQQAYILVPRDSSKLIEEWSGWADTNRHQLDFDFSKYRVTTYQFEGTKVTADYQIDWFDQVADTSAAFNWYNLIVFNPIPVNFTVRNLTTEQYIEFLFKEPEGTRNGRIDSGETVIFYEPTRTPTGADTMVTSWAVKFVYSLSGADTVPPADGDQLLLAMYQNATDNDEFAYTTTAARINADDVKLDRIKVYPNPYVAVSAQEPSNPYEEGRGERRLTFIHLPDRCTIRIYNVRGELVRKLDHLAPIDDGTEHWDLRSKDGLNVAYGIYLYHVESPYGERTGRFAVIK